MSFLNTLIPTIRQSSNACAVADQSSTPVRRPAYQVKETEDAYQLTVQLPGVAKDSLEVTSDNTEVRISGRCAWAQPEGWTAIHRESAEAAYELVLTHDNALNNDAIAAELRDGVLQVTLPKAEAIKPRKITVS